MEHKKAKLKCELYHDSFQNFKKYGIPKAQLVIADIPYNLGKWYARCNKCKTYSAPYDTEEQAGGN